MAQPQAMSRFALAGARAARVSVVTRRCPHALRCVHARSAQMIQVGDTLPDATLVEKNEEVQIRDLFKGKTAILLGMPGEFCACYAAAARLTHGSCVRSRLLRAGAYTPGCTKARERVLECARAVADGLPQTHLPGYIEHADELRAAGAQEIAVVCVNDPWVMAAWAKDMETEAQNIHMLADPRCEFAQGIGCTQDDTAKLGNIRSRRYSMIVENNVVKFINVEKPGPTVRRLRDAPAAARSPACAGAERESVGELPVTAEEHEAGVRRRGKTHRGRTRARSRPALWTSRRVDASACQIPDQSARSLITAALRCARHRCGAPWRAAAAQCAAPRCAAELRSEIWAHAGDRCYGPHARGQPSVGAPCRALCLEPPAAAGRVCHSLASPTRCTPWGLPCAWRRRHASRCAGSACAPPRARLLPCAA